MTRRHACAALLVAIAIPLAGCGDDQKDASAIDGDPSTTIPASLQDLTPKPARDPNTPLPKTTNVSGVTTDLNKKPVAKISGDAPDELQGQDVVVGTGPVAKTGDKIQVQYVGQLFDGGTEFDTSWKNATTPGPPFDVTLGEGGVIKGWDEGIPGMKVGGRRVLVIPADLAYGAQGSPPKIPASAPLVFVVDLKKLTPAKSSASTTKTTATTAK
jgi:FKBP-type peptidyl-prolyl cis-trans isomerase